MEVNLQNRESKNPRDQGSIFTKWATATLTSLALLHVSCSTAPKEPTPKGSIEIDIGEDLKAFLPVIDSLQLGRCLATIISTYSAEAGQEIVINTIEAKENGGVKGFSVQFAPAPEESVTAAVLVIISDKAHQETNRYLKSNPDHFLYSSIVVPSIQHEGKEVQVAVLSFMRRRESKGSIA